MGEPTAEPKVPVQPEAAVHRVDHAGAAIAELEPVECERLRVPGRRYCARLIGRVAHWQETTPSMVAGGVGAMLPEKSAQVNG